MSANKQNLEGNLRFRYRTHLKNGRDTECTVWEKNEKKASYDYDDSIKMLPRLLTTAMMVIIMNGCV